MGRRIKNICITAGLAGLGIVGNYHITNSLDPRLPKAAFEEVSGELKKLDGALYDSKGSIFWTNFNTVAKNTIELPDLFQVYEASKRGRVLYAEIDGRQFPIFANNLANSISPKRKLSDTLINLDKYVGKPVEIMGELRPYNNDSNTGFYIWTLRDKNPNEKGFLDNQVYRAIFERR